MAKSLIGFHYSSGGNKTGIGDLITKLNTAGIPILLKGTDDAGLCFEGQTKGQAHGVNNHLIYRVSTAGQPDNIEYDVPDYTKSPLAAATEHFNKTAAKWPIELHRETVWMEPINEPRAKLNPGDAQYQNMHPVDWLGYFMLEYAKIANGQGFRVCGPSFNSGEPQVFGGVNDYELPGMLAYFEYCAANPDKAALSIHEYAWDRWQHGESWPNWYPSLWGRVEAAVAAADKNNIPRAFPIFVTEWGFAHNNAPRWPECEPFLTAYNEWAARWLLTNGENQIKGVAAWTLSDGWGDVDLDLQSWFGPLGDYAVGTDFPEGPQPAKTHIDFWGTTPGDIPMDTWKEDVWKLGEQNKVLGFVTGAALQVQITADGYQALSNEYGFTRPDGKELVCQRAKHAVEGTFRTYYCIRPDFNTVYVIEAAGGTPTPPPFSGYDSPVGTAAERATAKIWPGHWFSANPFANRYQFPDGSWHIHTGDDLNLNVPVWNSDANQPVYAIADGRVIYAQLVIKSNGQVSSWGQLVVIEHDDGMISRCGHLRKMLVKVGDIVKKGQQIGTVGGTEYGLPDHKHIDISHSGILKTNPTYWPGDNLAAVLEHFVDPKKWIEEHRGEVEPPDPPPPVGIDLRRFMIADKTAFRVVRMPDGRGEDIQDMDLGGGMFVRRKNDLGEWWKVDASFFYLVHDTSPDNDSQGNERIYTLTKGGQPGAPKNPLFMSVGQSWTEAGTHHVQFRGKNNSCQNLSENSGNATNTAVLVSHKANYTFNAYGQNLTLDEVIFLKTGVEEQIYGRHNGKAVGWCGWKAPWGQSEIVELYWDRPPMVTEPNRYCSW